MCCSRCKLEDVYAELVYPVADVTDLCIILNGDVIVASSSVAAVNSVALHNTAENGIHSLLFDVKSGILICFGLGNGNINDIVAGEGVARHHGQAACDTADVTETGDGGVGDCVVHDRHLALVGDTYDTAVRAAIVYSLFSSCKAAGIDTRSWLEDVLRRIPSEKNIEGLLPSNWKVLPATTQ